MADSKKYDGSQWEHSLRKMTTASEIIVPPTTIYADGSNITTYTIKGNTVQNGTPTPSNPVDVVGVGERTENLFDDHNVINITGVGDRYGVILPDGTYSIYNETDNTMFYGVNNWIGRFTACSPHSTATITIENEAGKIGGVFMPLNSASQGGCTVVEGSTAPSSYIPYGYKIPISSGGVTTNIYLGSMQTVRQVKKLVLDGSENWTLSSYPNVYYTADFTDYLRELDTNLSLCSHYSTIGQVQGASFITNGVLSWYGRTDASRLYIGDVRFSTAAELQAYLAQQYAANTPVTVYYILATAETAAVNEPLMKIGDYADTLSNATAIPTTEGANSITVDTAVQPSEFTATWTGWHNSTVKEYDGANWN